MHHFPVDLLVSESKVGGVARNLLILLNCNLSHSSNLSSKFVLCVGHFPVDLILSEAKVGGCRQKPVAFVELEVVHF